jgi:hypothetical protein
MYQAHMAAPTQQFAPQDDVASAASAVGSPTALMQVRTPRTQRDGLQRDSKGQRTRVAMLGHAQMLGVLTCRARRRTRRPSTTMGSSIHGNRRRRPSHRRLWTIAGPKSAREHLPQLA